MNGDCEAQPEQLCGCCAGVGPETPQAITNRPGLSAIAYRVGTHGTFKASMLAALSDPDYSALAALRTRDNSDFTIALLDSYAVVADIITFYQERLANESYLRTAVDQRSVFELARLVGFVPSPGVAASAYLAFTLSDAPGSPDNVLISAGTRVQSVPGPGQTPQTFETSADITAKIAGNALPAQTTQVWVLNAGDKSTWLQGTNNNLSVGDALLFVSSNLHSTLTSGAADFHYISAVTLDSNSGNTFVQWDQPIVSSFSSDSSAYVYVFRKKAALFGSQAPNPWVVNTPSIANLPEFPSGTGTTGDWKFQYTANSGQVNLDSSISGLGPTAGGEPQWGVFTSPHYTALLQINSAADTGPNLYTLTSKTTQLTLANNGQVLVNNTQSTAYLNSLITQFLQYESLYALYLTLGQPAIASQYLALAQQALTLFIEAITPVTSDQVLADFVAQTRNTTAYVQSNLLTPAAPPLIAWSYDGIYSRQTNLLKPVEGNMIEVLGGQQISISQPIAISGKRMRLQVIKASGASFVPDHSSNSLTVTDGQIFIMEAFPPATDATGALNWKVSTTNGVAGFLYPESSTYQLIAADTKDLIVSESALINQTTAAGPVTTLNLNGPLARIYDRSTVAINANVVASTNGETMYEILGSGDATNPQLQFSLKQQPLTYLSSPTGTGTQSTLQVRVNNLQWHEVDNFLASQSSDRVFVTSADQSGKTTVQFGDGIEGARTPTGQLNITATYRKGIGSAGMVATGQLSQAIDRPQGLKNVANPDPASGGADPDTAETARSSAPLHVLTLDRVVSLEDYQNFALAFAGISASLATWTWFGRTRGIFLTVAGANGAILKSDDPTLLNLINALRSSGNPYIPLQVASYSPVLFEVGASIRVDRTTYDPTLVLGQVWQSLSTNFSFSNRALAQGVAQSEIIATVQQIPGVIALELTAFNRQGSVTTNPLPAVLRAATPVVGINTPPTPAEMLLLDPASIGNLGVWS
jgi:hypothetical protein